MERFRLALSRWRSGLLLFLVVILGGWLIISLVVCPLIIHPSAVLDGPLHLSSVATVASLLGPPIASVLLINIPHVVFWLVGMVVYQRSLVDECRSLCL